MHGTERGEDSSPKPAYFREGVDINWGDSLYLCDTCVRILGELRGMLDVEAVQEIQKNLEIAEKKLEQTEKDLADTNDRVDRMLDGVRAKKEAEKARTPKKTTKKKVTANA